MIIPAVSNSSAILILESSSCNDLHKCRTIWNIIWSSLFTLFACVWLSVHPNIPAPDDSWGRKGTRRVWTMIAVLLGPELLVGWAMRQRILASKIAEENKDYGWTETHGFFAVMGGFLECDEDGRPARTVTVDDVDIITEKTKRGIREAEIMDRSKGDVLAKAFAMLQTAWFILQCIARPIEGLPVTKLEIATVAFCVLNLATYVLWWKKPLNVSHPVRVYGGEGTTDDDAGRGCDSWTAFTRGLADIPREVCRPIARIVDENGGNVFKTAAGLAVSIPKTIMAGESYESNPRRVGTFGPRHDATHLDMITSAAVGAVFGVVHCTAWACQFPSHTEQVLWRVAAVSVTAVPLVMALLRGVQALGCDLLVKFVMMAAVLLYFFARLALLALPLMSLRSLPPGALAMVSWVRFIPHV